MTAQGLEIDGALWDALAAADLQLGKDGHWLYRIAAELVVSCEGKRE